jgi:Cu/Ag efflux pump CusA
MMPIVLGFGGDASFRQPMAVAVVGGLITSTALSLLVVPVVFTYINMMEVFLLKRGKLSPNINPQGDKSFI